MHEFKQNAAMMRGEEALHKEKRLKVGRSAPHYQIQGDDIYLLTGPYKNHWVKSLWAGGSQGRDYVYQYLYTSKDKEVQRIVRQCFCS